jgi:hypothetical protein
MRKIRQLCAALVLTFALSASALAGQVDCPGITDEPPSEETTASGYMQTGITDVLLIMLSLV